MHAFAHRQVVGLGRFNVSEVRIDVGDEGGHPGVRTRLGLRCAHGFIGDERLSVAVCRIDLAVGVADLRIFGPVFASQGLARHVKQFLELVIVR